MSSTFLFEIVDEVEARINNQYLSILSTFALKPLKTTVVIVLLRMTCITNGIL